MATGIRKRGDSYEASVYLKREKRKVRKTFDSLAAAKSWRADAVSLAAKGALRAPKPTTVREAWEAWEAGAKAGAIHNRSGEPYKPASLRSYERVMRLRVLDEFGAAKLADVQRSDLQRFVYELSADGLNASTVQVTLLPLRAIFNHAVTLGDLLTNPCAGLKMPAIGRGRDRIASPQEAEALIDAVPDGDRALWATAMFGGLRCGELQALRAECIDLAGGVIRVEAGWDAKEGRIELKSHAGWRRVPIAAVLRDPLLDELARSGRRGTDLLFGRTADDPFRPGTCRKRADKAWERAGIDRLTFHECRHTFASLMIAAGVNAKALSTYMGHANISITLDRYGHLMPGNEDEAAGLLDSYLKAQREREDGRARGADPAGTGAFTGASGVREDAKTALESQE